MLTGGSCSHWAHLRLMIRHSQQAAAQSNDRSA